MNLHILETLILELTNLSCKAQTIETFTNSQAQAKECLQAHQHGAHEVRALTLNQEAAKDFDLELDIIAPYGIHQNFIQALSVM